MDIVQLANCVMTNSCEEDVGCAGHVAGNEIYSVLDIVQLANCVLSQNCAGEALVG